MAGANQNLNQNNTNNNNSIRINIFMSENTRPDLISALDTKKTNPDQTPIHLQIATFFQHLGDVLCTLGNQQTNREHLWLAGDKI